MDSEYPAPPPCPSSSSWSLLPPPPNPWRARRGASSSTGGGSSTSGGIVLSSSSPNPCSSPDDPCDVSPSSSQFVSATASPFSGSYSASFSGSRPPPLESSTTLSNSSGSLHIPIPSVASAATSVSSNCVCDVYIGAQCGRNPSLSRFRRWLRAELELQGISCFSASSTCPPPSTAAASSSAEVVTKQGAVLWSCIFGVVVITAQTFANKQSMEELAVFQRRKNLVPIFFNLSHSDCFIRDIVERRGEMWEREGGELWLGYGGDEREWRDVMDRLTRTEEWKLEAQDGSNWRNCILRAVNLLGTRLGRRSIMERQKARKGRVESEEFPFPKNPIFVGREKELKALESLLFPASSEPVDRVQILKEFPRSFLHWGNRLPNTESVIARRRSDADRMQYPNYEDPADSRRKSDSDQGLLEGAREDSAGEIQIVEPRAHRGSTRALNRHRQRNLQRERHLARLNVKQEHSARTESAPPNHPRVPSSSSSADSNIVCISGVSGIGKTELALEFAHRYAQRYRRILWVSGETRYLRQSYLNLSAFLGLDVGTDSQIIGSDSGQIRSFDELEMEAFQRVRRELQRDIPYLLIIDNLESEKDWWDGRDIADILPRWGGLTHVLITTRLLKVMNMEPLEIWYLSGVEALSLMKGKRRYLQQDLDALKQIEEKLGRVTIGLAITGSILAQQPMTPTQLLDRVSKGAATELQWEAREDQSSLRNNPFLVKLLELCFSLLEQADKQALSMVWVGAWFAPFSVPVSLLALASSKLLSSSESSSNSVWARLKSWAVFGSRCCISAVSNHAQKQEEISTSLLTSYGIAKRCSDQQQGGSVHFHEIVQLYGRKRGGTNNLAAKAMLETVLRNGSIPLHSHHFWAASFLVLGFGNDPIAVEVRLAEIVPFVERVLQLSYYSFASFSRCKAAMEVLRLCTNMLDEIERPFVSRVGQADFSEDWWCCCCCRRRRWASNGRNEIDESNWQQITLTKAVLLESRADLMLKGGQFDAGEELCRRCISIRTVMLGENHPQTLSAQQTLAKLVRFRSSHP